MDESRKNVEYDWEYLSGVCTERVEDEPVGDTLYTKRKSFICKYFIRIIFI